MDTFNLKLDTQKLSVEITKILNKERINQLASETGFTCRNGGKIDGYEFLDILLFTQFNDKGQSLNDLSTQLHKKHDIVIRKQSIDERFNAKAFTFFKAVLGEAINISINSSVKINFTQYDRVRIKDSTSFQLPDNMKDKYKGSGGSASKACIRIQFEYDLKNGEILDLSFHSYTDQDITNAKNTLDDINANELVIRDLGYIKIDYLRKIENKKAFYLNRLQSGTNVYEKINKKFVKIDFAKLYKYMKFNNIIRIDRKVYIGSKEKFETRMIIELLPKKIYEERLRKANVAAKKKGNKISAERKAKMGLNILITNTDIPKENLRPLYTMRWQIELMFKIWKSIGEINKVKKMKVERFETCLCAKLIWVVLNWQIMRQIVGCFFKEYDMPISPYKLFKTLKSSILEFRESIINGCKQINNFIKELIKISPHNHISEKKKGSLTWSYEIMRMF